MPIPPPPFTPHPTRRRLLGLGRWLLAGAVLPQAPRAFASVPDARQLSFHHTHTGERLALVYAIDDQFVPEALFSLNHFLRDHYSGAIGSMDPQLFNLLHLVRQELGTQQPFEVISGYRSPATNNTLRGTRGGGVAKHSLHMVGKAIDVRLPGVPLTELRDAALSLRQGGVGFYPSEQFVHLDTGPVRRW
ncbi:MAG: YcbK family protein [Pseudomonadota bacterium]